MNKHQILNNSGEIFQVKTQGVGRRVIFELNKSYPVIMSPMMEKEELKEVFLKFLSYYDETIKL
ncbi:hypothetical protein [uncultured Clostridium sp.]|uniref:hypothetical protein n=1 Tax=uncultured Clostridium sp. TaxID=59620 RepID=UPI0025838421|nr:hypothetical protein [uncultured Clostridium sp.]